MKVQDRLKQTRFIEIHQVKKKRKVEYFSNRPSIRKFVANTPQLTYIVINVKIVYSYFNGEVLDLSNSRLYVR